MPMLDPDITKWPAIYQIATFVGAVLAGALMWLRGARTQPAGPAAENLSLELKAMRADFKMILEAEKESLDGRLDKLTSLVEDLVERLQRVETFKAILEDRESRHGR